MINRTEILEIVISTVMTLVETLPEEQKFSVNENTILFGNGSNIDSLSLVSIIVDLETTLSEDLNIDVSLSDDKAMMRTKSPFESIKSLVDYINELINQN
jgi:acyl carrier protein